MAAGGRILTSSGKRGILSSGKRAAYDNAAACSDCCGCAQAIPADQCANCDDFTPSTMQVTLSGVTLCSACTDLGFAGINYSLVSWASLNTTYTLSQIANKCKWQADGTTGLTGSVRGRAYFATDCSGSAYIDDTYAMFMELEKTATEHTLTLYAAAVASLASIRYLLFRGSVSSPTDGADQLCGSAISFPTNAATTCTNPGPGTGGETAATGGSASAICL